MGTIQALNAKTSSHQRPYRVTIWAGREDWSGCRAEWVVYGASVRAAVSRAVQSFRGGVGKGQRFSDWTINVEPVRADEDIVPA